MLTQKKIIVVNLDIILIFKNCNVHNANQGKVKGVENIGEILKIELYFMIMIQVLIKFNVINVKKGIL